MAGTEEITALTLTGDPIVEEARKRFERVAEWESTFRTRFIEDIKFRHGDSDNGYQWPNAIKRSRDLSSKPCLTINQIRQHNLQISNDAKQNKSSINIRATGGGATKKASDALRVLLQRIEYQSNAQDVYSTACEFQVDGGYGVWRLLTRYADNDSFDQEIFLQRVPDPLSVYLDCDCVEKDKSDAKWGFAFDDVPRDQFESAYPKWKDMVGKAPLGAGTATDHWFSRDMVRVCEYFRIVTKHDTLVEFTGSDGQRKTIRKSRMPQNMQDEVIADPQSRTREIEEPECEWYLIVGQEKVDTTVWQGKYVPLVVVLGEEIVINGVMDRKGHTRALKDGQRMFNYNASSQVEFVALQGKTPWIAPIAAIEEIESMWNTANTASHSVLTYRHVDDQGNPIPPPVRQEPPKESTAFQVGMDTAFNQLMMASGQWQNQMGMMGNERTGAAIDKRQHQSETSVFHFQDNYASALRYTGRQILDLIPKIYDTKRLLKAIADDGEELEIQIDPSAKQAYVEQLNAQNETVKRIFNPSIGKYDVESDVGPAYGSRREETVAALTLLLTQAPALTGIVGDLLLNAMQFKEAQEAAARLKRMVPQQALGKGPTQQEQALMAQVQQLKVALTESLNKQAKEQIRLAGKDQMRDIDAYEAETKRFAALEKALMLDDGGLEAVIHQLVGDALETHLKPILDANKDGISEQSGGSAPTLSNDGSGNPLSPGSTTEWFLQNPARMGRYLKLGALAQQHTFKSTLPGG